VIQVAGIDHLTITVGNFAKSKAFCAPLMEFLGFDLQYDGSDMVGWTNGKTHFWIAAADAEGNKHKYHKGDIGFHHYGFRLRSRKDVDALEAFLEKHGPKIGIWPANITTTIAPCFSSIPTA
jgi:catechol 2,3-dioxygenase-like lactoylglutathione lyase family enzyme